MKKLFQHEVNEEFLATLTRNDVYFLANGGIKQSWINSAVDKLRSGLVEYFNCSHSFGSLELDEEKYEWRVDRTLPTPKVILDLSAPLENYDR